MAKNRKHLSAAVRFAPAIKVLLICSFLVASGVGYVWQKNQIVDLGRRQAILEGRWRRLREQAQQVERKLMVLQSPASLELKVRDFKLGLGRVEPDKVVKLVEPSSVETTVAVGEAQGRNPSSSGSLNRGRLADR